MKHFGSQKRMVECIENLNIEHDKSKFNKVTISAGCFSISPSTTTTCEELLLKADSALYHAKSAGRNQAQLFVSSDIIEPRSNISEAKKH